MLIVLKKRQRVACLMMCVLLIGFVGNSDQAWAKALAFKFEQQSADPQPGGEVEVGGKLRSKPKSCDEDRLIRIQRSEKDAYDFETIAETVTSDQGKFAVQVTVYETADYRAVAAAREKCGKPISLLITIHTS